MRFLPVVGILVVSGSGAIWEACASAVPGLLEREIPAGSPPRPSRFIEGDRGDPVPYLIDIETLPEGIDREQAIAAVGNAFAAWAGATGIRFELEKTADFGQPASDFAGPGGGIRIQCHDTYGAISENGVLGIGGSGSTNGGFPEGGSGGKVFGEEFHRTARGYVILNHRNPLLSSPSTFEEVVCHEIGHILGLEHSSETYPEPDLERREALMYLRVHGDGRGASLGRYDLLAAQKAYPTNGRPPGVFPATMSTISVSGGAEPPAECANTIKLAAVDFDGPVETLKAELHEKSTGNFGTFSLEGHSLLYLPGNSIDEPGLDPTGDGFYDRAYFRVCDGEHGSAYEAVRVVKIAHDSYPTDVSDGLPDGWMIEHFGDPVPVEGISGALDDPDQDGSGNLDEFLQETDPMDPSSNTRVSFDTSSTEAEEGEALAVTLSANRKLARTIDLSVSSAGSAQKGGVDYLARGWTDQGGGVTIPAGRRTRELVVEVADDGIEEIDESIELALTGPRGVLVDEPSRHRIIVSGDVPAPVYNFAAATVTVTEQNGIPTAAGVTVIRSGNTGIASTVKLAPTSDSSRPATGSEPVLIEFAPGDTSATVAIPIGDDRVDEPVERVGLGFVEFVPYGVAGTIQPTAQLQVYDDDDPPNVSVSDTSKNEAGGFLEFTVSLDEVSAFPITLHYLTNPGTATPGDDYSQVRGELLVPAGAGEGVISVPIFNDVLDEYDETVLLVLSDAIDATIVGAQGTGTILDNDPLPQGRVFDAAGEEGSEILRFLVWLSAPSGREITFSYATGDQTAVSGSDYSGVTGTARIPPGAISHIVDVQLLQDSEEEETETFTLFLAEPTNVNLVEDGATGSILNVPPRPFLTVVGSTASEGDGSIVFTVHLSFPVDTTLVVPYRLSSGTAEVGEDILVASDQTVTFPPGTTESSLPVAIRDDSTDEEDEQFTVEMLVDASDGLRGTEPGIGTIYDNDAPSQIVVRTAEGGEASRMIPTTLRIQPPSGKEIRVRYETVDGTAVSGDDYEALSGSLVIPPYTEEAIVQLAVVDDSLVERVETLYFQLVSWENADQDGARIMLTLLDDDLPAPPNLVVREFEGTLSMSLEWQGVEGGIYQVETSQDLRGWRALDPPLRVQATGSPDSFDDVPSEGARGFYRISEVAEGE